MKSPGGRIMNESTNINQGACPGDEGRAGFFWNVPRIVIHIYYAPLH